MEDVEECEKKLGDIREDAKKDVQVTEERVQKASHLNKDAQSTSRQLDKASEMLDNALILLGLFSLRCAVAEFFPSRII